jgi:type 1 glutamine amidotransferase
MRTTTITAASIFALFAAACGDASQSADELNADLPDDTMDGAGGSDGAGGGTPGAGGGTPGAGGGTPGTGGGTPGTGAMDGAGGTYIGTGSNDGAGGTDIGTGGSDGPGSGGVDGAGGTVEPAGPYDPREGSFKMLVYSRTAAFRHDSSIFTGRAMLQEIADEQGFEVDMTQDEDDSVTEDNQPFSSVDALSEYEIVFFMNSTGALFSPAQKAVYEEWMTTRNGAFAGVHSATDTENGWAFYSEVTGQYYDGHGNANTPGAIQLESSQLSHPALVGLPNPWQRNEEWYNFNSFQQWITKPGFAILGRKQADNQPITWIREWGNFRAFYTGLGHDSNVFEDANVKKHVTGGIMWAVRREHLIQ